LSVKATAYLSIGIVILLILTIAFGGYLMALVLTAVEQGKSQSEDNRMAIQDLKENVIPRLDKAYEQIIQFQSISNETGQNVIMKLFESEDNLLGNLTDHRTISNVTRDLEIGLLKQILNRTR
jgi:hypothetical protein